MHRHDHLHPCLSSHGAEQLSQQPLYLYPPPHGNSCHGLQPLEGVPAPTLSLVRPVSLSLLNDSISHPFTGHYGSLQHSASLPPTNDSLSHPFAVQYGILQHSSATTLPPSQNSNARVGTVGSSHVLVSPRFLMSGWVASQQPVSAPMQLPSSYECMVEPQLAQKVKDHPSRPKRMKRLMKHKGVKKRRLERESAVQVLSDMPDSTMAGNLDQSIIPTTVSSTIIGVPVEAEPTVKEMTQLERGPGWCSLCQRDCATAAMLQVHIIGKKHRRKLEVEKDVVQVTLPAADTDINLQRVPALNVLEQIWELDLSTAGQESKLIMPGSNTGKKVVDGGMVLAAVTSDHGEKRPGGEVVAKNNVYNISTVTSSLMAAADESWEMRKDKLTRCELCNVQCDTEAVLETHFTGKKHAARLRNLRMQNTNFPLSS